jgi:hypothetical protein
MGELDLVLGRETIKAITLPSEMSADDLKLSETDENLARRAIARRARNAYRGAQCDF